MPESGFSCQFAIGFGLEFGLLKLVLDGRSLRMAMLPLTSQPITAMPNEDNLQVMRRIRLPSFRWSKLPVAWPHQEKQAHNKTPEEKQFLDVQFFLFSFYRFVLSSFSAFLEMKPRWMVGCLVS